QDYLQPRPRARRLDEIPRPKGRSPWVAAFEEAEKRGIRLVELGGIQLRNPVIIMAEGDLVTAVYKGTLPDPDDKARPYEAFSFETVRIKDGKFVEHWDQVTLAPGWMKR